MESLGCDGYYGPVEEVMSAFSSREAAEAGLEQKRQEEKADRHDWIQKRYNGGDIYPEIWGGKEGANRSIEEAGKNLFIREVPFSE